MRAILLDERKLRNILLYVALAGLVFAGLALADVDPTAPQPEGAFWGQLALFLQGLKGASVKGIVMGVVQVAMVFFVTPYGNFTGKAKRLIVLGLSCVGIFVGNLIAGLDLLPALLAGPMLGGLQIFLFELIAWMKGGQAVVLKTPAQG